MVDKLDTGGTFVRMPKAFVIIPGIIALMYLLYPIRYFVELSFTDSLAAGIAALLGILVASAFPLILFGALFIHFRKWYICVDEQGFTKNTLMGKTIYPHSMVVKLRTHKYNSEQKESLEIIFSDGKRWRVKAGYRDYGSFKKAANKYHRIERE